ncbi:hypothetical protein ACLOJK_036919 [Asimina triloba]
MILHHRGHPLLALIVPPASASASKKKIHMLHLQVKFDSLFNPIRSADVNNNNLPLYSR